MPSTKVAKPKPSLASSYYRIFGEPDFRTEEQLWRCAKEATYAVLCADAHVGYSAPIGSAIAYRDHVSPSGVGYDIGCGTKAVRTDLKVDDVDVAAVMDEIPRRISFGMGRVNHNRIEHPVIDGIATASFKPQRALLDLARSQLGTVGAGNHYVDLLADENGYLWVGVHFGSRGFGHKTASGFLALANGRDFTDPPPGEDMDAPPTLFTADSPWGQDYIEAMRLAGDYAYAGRDWVTTEVCEILGVVPVESVHNHHNYAWRERHFGEDYWVVRKGCTPARPGQQGFVGGSMGDMSVILEGVDSPEAAKALYSTVHGAGRSMSRSRARGKMRWVKDETTGQRMPTIVSKGEVDWDAVRVEIAARGIELRGGGADEAPEVYKDLTTVLNFHSKTIKILHTLRPVGVAMAGADTDDPYRD